MADKKEEPKKDDKPVVVESHYLLKEKVPVKKNMQSDYYHKKDDPLPAKKKPPTTGADKKVGVEKGGARFQLPTQKRPGKTVTGVVHSKHNATAITSARTDDTSQISNSQSRGATSGSNISRSTSMDGSTTDGSGSSRTSVSQTNEQPTIAAAGANATTTSSLGANRFLTKPHADKTGRYVLVLRHGERVDRVFPTWLRTAFKRGTYEPYDLNLPLKLPKRRLEDFNNDTPMTEFGGVALQMVGRAMRIGKAYPTHIYSSPALRCVQSAQNVIKAMGLMNANIKIEPALFEWLGWYDTTPRWLTEEEMIASGFQIDINYKPMMPMKKLLQCKQESSVEYYERSSAALDRMLDQTRDQGAIILVVGHAPTIDACCRPLLGHTTKRVTRQEMEKTSLRYPYASMAAVEEVDGRQWRLMDNALKPITSLDINNRIDQNYFNRHA